MEDRVEEGDEIFSNMTKKELRRKPGKTGFIVIDGSYGFIELEEESFGPKPVACPITK